MNTFQYRNKHNIPHDCGKCSDKLKDSERCPWCCDRSDLGPFEGSPMEKRMADADAQDAANRNNLIK